MYGQAGDRVGTPPTTAFVRSEVVAGGFARPPNQRIRLDQVLRMPGTEAILRPFATEMRHLSSALNAIASDMIRDRTLAKKLDDDPEYFRNNYTVTDEELKAMRDRNMIRLYELGLHPFPAPVAVLYVELVVRIIGYTPFWSLVMSPRSPGAAAIA